MDRLAVPSTDYRFRDATLGILAPMTAYLRNSLPSPAAKTPVCSLLHRLPLLFYEPFVVRSSTSGVHCNDCPRYNIIGKAAALALPATDLS